MPRKRIPVPVPEHHKFCHSCQTVHHVESFYRNRSQPDGLTSQCRECAKESGKASRNMSKLVEEVAAEMRAYFATRKPEPYEPSYPPMSRAHL